MPSRIAEPNQLALGDPDVPESDPVTPRLQEASFDPVDFLNGAISPFASSNNQQNSSRLSKVAHIQNTATQVQDILAKLNAQNIRYSNTLSQLTDEILRSGSRLAYEVEILRGDANGLHEILTDTLREDIKRLGEGAQTRVPNGSANEDGSAVMPGQEPQTPSAQQASSGQEPDFIPQLRMLGHVKARLEEVINVFGEAMEWPLAPSELSLTSSLISVSGPEPGSDTHTREEKAKEATKRLRAEVITLLGSNGGGYAGLQAAADRVESLKSLTTVWKGTAEEKARTKFVDSLARLVEERRKGLDMSQESGRQGTEDTSQRPSSIPGRSAASQARSDRNTNEGSNQSGGLLRNLQRLRNDFYLD